MTFLFFYFAHQKPKEKMKNTSYNPDKSLTSFLFVLSTVLSILILLYRKPEALTKPQFFAEDGVIFFQQCFQSGARSIFISSAGYLHLIPRFVALLTSYGISYECMPAAYNIASLIIFLGVVCFIWWRTAFDPYTKFFMTLAMTLVPVGNETVLCITNVQWYVNLFIPLFFLAGYNKKYAILDGFALFMVGLSGPFSAVFLPAIGALLWFRSRKSGQWKNERWFFFILLLTALIQLLVLRFSTTRPNLGWNTAQKIAHSPRMLYLQATNPLGIERFYTEETHYGLFALLLFVLLGWIFLCWRRLRTKADPLPLFLLLAALCDVAANVYSLDPITAPHLHPIFNSMRYFLGPCILFFWSVLAYSSTPGETRETAGKAGEIPEPSQTPENVTTASKRNVFFLLVCAYYTVVLVRTIPGFALADKNWPEQAKKIESFQKGHLEIPINPEGWKISLDK